MKRFLIIALAVAALGAAAVPQVIDRSALVERLRYVSVVQEMYMGLFRDIPQTEAYYRGRRDAFNDAIVILNGQPLVPVTLTLPANSVQQPQPSASPFRANR